MEKIAVIGIGKLGLCVALQLEKAGYEVLGVDVNVNYVKAINNKTLQSAEPGIKEALASSINFHATDCWEELARFNASLIFIAVATPTAEVDGYDHGQVDAVLSSLYNLGISPTRKDVVVICTTLPGYCDSKAAEAQTKNYYLSYHPEFIAQGSIMHDLQHPDQLLIGEADSIAGDRIEKVYKKIYKTQPPVCRMNRLSAEIAKLATNCFLTMKIAFANAIGDLAAIAGAETEKILDVIGADSRIGNKFLQYGYGYGGPCFPRDNRALQFFAKQNNYELLIAIATDKANSNHLHFQVNQYLHKYQENEPIHFYSVAYKPGTTIIEESQQLALAVRLAQEGRKVVIHEDQKVIRQLQEQFGELFQYIVLNHFTTV